MWSVRLKLRVGTGVYETSCLSCDEDLQKIRKEMEGELEKNSLPNAIYHENGSIEVIGIPS
mgnify:CR=1 FL=1